MIPLDVTGVAIEQCLRNVLRGTLPAENCSILSDADNVEQRKYVGFLVQAEAPDTVIKREDGTPALATYPVTLTYLADTREACLYVFTALQSLGGIFSRPNLRSAIERLPLPFKGLTIVDSDSSNGSVAETTGKRFDFSIQFNFECFPLLAAETEE